jgi:opacity protein-like surface antigen
MVQEVRSFRLVLSFLFLILTVVASVASAQDGPSPAANDTTPAPVPRGVIDVDTGTAFGNTPAHLAYIGGAGITLGAHVDVTGEFGRLDNIITKTLRDDVRDTAQSLSATVGSPVTAAASTPADYGLARVRFSMKTSARMGLFADAGIGVARVNPQLSALAAGVDVSGQLLQTVTLEPSQTALVTTIGGGFSVRLSPRATIDAGYRLGRISLTTAAYTNTLYGGLRLGF